MIPAVPAHDRVFDRSRLTGRRSMQIEAMRAPRPSSQARVKVEKYADTGEAVLWANAMGRDTEIRTVAARPPAIACLRASSPRMSHRPAAVAANSVMGQTR